MVNENDRPARTALIYEGELDYLSRCILDYPDIETGGQLFGYWTADGVPVVLYAIGPGPRANHSYAFFNQDVDYLVGVGELLVARYGLQHIGEWHSHHRLGLAVPSGHDASTMVNCIRRQNLGRFLLAIGNCTDAASTLNAFNFSQGSGYDHVHAAWDVKRGESPFRRVVDSDTDLSRLLVAPRTVRAAHGNLLKAGEAVGFQVPAYAAGHWLKEKANNLVLKRMVDMLAVESDDGQCRVQLDAEKCVHLAVEKAGREVRIVFPRGFPLVAPIVSNGDHLMEREGVEWRESADLYGSFKTYYENLTKRNDNDPSEISGRAAGVDPVSGSEPVQVPGNGNAERPCGDGGANQPEERVHAVHGAEGLSDVHAEGLRDPDAVRPGGQCS